MMKRRYLSSSFFSFLSVLALIFMISACGFTPLHGTKAGLDDNNALNNAPWRSTIFIDTIPEKIGQSLRNILIDGLTPKRAQNQSAIKYRLKVQQPKEERVSIGIDRESEATTRVQVLMTARFQIIDNDSKDIALNSEARGFVSYNVLDSQFESIISRRDATDRALNLLADDITRQTSLYFHEKLAQHPVQKMGAQ